MIKLPTQPLCRYCGEPIRKYTNTISLRTRKPGEDRLYPSFQVATLPTTRAEAQRFTRNGHQIVRVKRTRRGNGISQFTTWDGESYVDEFFCNGSHARHFAYAAAQAGHRTKAYAEKANAQNANSQKAGAHLRLVKS